MKRRPLLRIMAPGSRPASRRHDAQQRSEEHTSELQSRGHLVCRLLLEKKNPCGIELRTNAIRLYACLEVLGTNGDVSRTSRRERAPVTTSNPPRAYDTILVVTFFTHQT